ncbi:MAG: LPS export ABC transporter periplasmic protein LptC [Phyllobacteriaceae bacterium]|nr:LPS export ABC transporter periplasmic protein LptC [Phyllobacteriaceae bacterium]
MDDTSTMTTRGSANPGEGIATPVRRPAAHIDADRHSRRVRLFKILLPSLGIAAALAVGGLTWAKMHFAAGVDVRNVLFSKDGLTMVEPRLSGRAQGRTYDVSAARAFQSIEDPKVVRMEVIDGRLELSDGTSVKIESARGVYDGNRETLHLEGGVTIAASNGWRAEGASADVDLVGGRIEGREGVRIDGPTARLEADRFDLTDNGHHALFSDKVRMTVLPEGAAVPTPDAPLAPTP